jgi:hypothetical protein
MPRKVDVAASSWVSSLIALGAAPVRADNTDQDCGVGDAIPLVDVRAPGSAWVLPGVVATLPPPQAVHFTALAGPGGRGRSRRFFAGILKSPVNSPHTHEVFQPCLTTHES